MKRVQGYYQARDSLKARAYILFTIEKPEDAETSLNNLFLYQGPWLSMGAINFY